MTCRVLEVTLEVTLEVHNFHTPFRHGIPFHWLSRAYKNVIGSKLLYAHSSVRIPKKTRSTPVMSNSIANNDTFFHKRCNRRTSTSSTRSVFQFPALLINHGFSKRWIYDAVVVVPKQTKHNSTEQTHTHETQDEDRRRTIGVYKNQRPTVSANPHLLHEVGVWKETQMNQHHSCNSSRIQNVY